MPSIQISIQPFDIPEEVIINVPGQDDDITVAIAELDEETLAGLVDEFATAVMAKAKK
jgi:hypothetical protein